MRTKQKRTNTLKGRNCILKRFINTKKAHPHWFDEEFERLNGKHTFARWLELYVYLEGNAKKLLK